MIVLKIDLLTEPQQLDQSHEHHHSTLGVCTHVKRVVCIILCTYVLTTVVCVCVCVYVYECVYFLFIICLCVGVFITMYEYLCVCVFGCVWMYVCFGDVCQSVCASI